MRPSLTVMLTVLASAFVIALLLFSDKIRVYTAAYVEETTRDLHGTTSVGGNARRRFDIGLRSGNEASSFDNNPAVAGTASGHSAAVTDARGVHRRLSTSDEMRYILYGVGEHVSMYDQQLFDYIRTQISQQSPRRHRQLAHPKKIDSSQMGQSALVDKVLSKRRNGFFIECGASDGEQFSNSLFFELARNWTGILIEANPFSHRTILDKNRRAYVMHTCLSTKRRPTTVSLQTAGVLSSIVSWTVGKFRGQPKVQVNCFPLNTIMAALGVSHVDYMSLDVEGSELEILRTIDWTRLRIDVLTVEYRIIGLENRKALSLQKLKDIRKYFRDTGLYKEVGVLPVGSDSGGLDVVFARI